MTEPGVTHEIPEASKPAEYRTKPAKVEKPAVAVRFGMPVKRVKVIDGDTLLLTFEVEEYIRLNGIDAPERRVPDEAAAAEVVKRAVEWWWRQQTAVSIDPVDYDKFGQRLIGTVSGDWGEWGRLEPWLLSRRLARPYNGERKTMWTEGELSVILAQANDFPAEPQA